MKILMFYYYTPSATAEYLVKAMRNFHEVKTFGPQLSGTLHHDFPLPNGFAAVDQIFEKLSRNWTPDLFFMIDSPYSLYPKGISSLPVPTAFYAIDTHIAFPSHRTLAPLFDMVFVAQKQFINPLRKYGADNVFWMPLACDPQVHQAYDLPKIHDLCFLGGKHTVERINLLTRLSRRFKIYVDFVGHMEMTKIYSQSKIVFNKSIGNDLNMRVFEAMSSGSLLITDRLISNGLEELFTDRQELVLYNEHDLEDLIEHYLKHEEEREKIAGAGCKKVREFHTYEHRAEQAIALAGELSKQLKSKKRNKISEKVSFGKIWFYQSRIGQWLKHNTIDSTYRSVGLNIN